MRERNAVFCEEFHACFAVLRAAGLRVFVTSDFLTATAAVDAHLRDFETFERMRSLARELALPEADIEFMRDTLEMILLARRFYLLPPPRAGSADQGGEEDLQATLAALAPAAVSHPLDASNVRRRTVSWLARLLVRRQRGIATCSTATSR